MMETEHTEKSRGKVIGWILALVAFIILAALVSVTSAIVFALFYVAMMLETESGVPMKLSLALLCFSAALLALKQQSAAETLANWAYYSFSIAIALQLIGYLKSDPGRSTNAD